MKRSGVETSGLEWNENEEFWHNRLATPALVVMAPHGVVEGVEQDSGNVMMLPRAWAHQARHQGAPIRSTAEGRQSHEVDLPVTSAVFLLQLLFGDVVCSRSLARSSWVAGICVYDLEAKPNLAPQAATRHTQNGRHGVYKILNTVSKL